MTEEERAKQQLNALLRDTGLKDEIKRHLRVRLAERLHGHPEKVTGEGLKHRMIVSAVKEYLDRIGCSYTSSIFCAESGYEQKLLERNELQQLLNVSNVDSSLSIVEHVFGKVTRDSPFLKNAQIQTTEDNPALSLEQKFAVIDLQFRRVLQQRNQTIFPSTATHSCTEEKAWYERQLVRFKEFQAHKIKMKVGQEWRIKFQAYAAEMETAYSRKLDKVRQREKILVQDFTRKEKGLNQRIHSWQASARSRMELIQMKQATANREKVGLELQRKRAGEEARKSIGQSKDKARQYQNLILSMEKRISYEVGLAKLGFEQQQASKEEQQLARRKFVEEEYDKLMRIADTMGFVTKQNERLAQENEAVRTESQDLRKQLREARGELGRKEERLENLKEQSHNITLERQQLKTELQNQEKVRKKREEELAKTRKELDNFRARFEEQSQDSIDVGPHRPPLNPTSMKIQKLREQRKKEIQRFKLQL